MLSRLAFLGGASLADDADSRPAERPGLEGRPRGGACRSCMPELADGLEPGTNFRVFGAGVRTAAPK